MNHTQDCEAPVLHPRRDEVSFLKQYQELEAESTRRKRHWGLKYFVPNGKQLASFQSSASTVIVVAGNRSGKTTSGAIETLCHCLNFYPSCTCHGEWFSKRRRFTRPVKCVIVTTEYPIIERAIEPRLMQYLPKEELATQGIKRTPQGYLRRVLFRNASTIDVLTNEMDQMAFESADWDFAWVDEPTQKSKYEAIRRGLLDRNGLARITFTPLIEPWMKEDLVDKEDGVAIHVVPAVTYDNTVDIHGSAILDQKLIHEWEVSLDSDTRRTRVYGEFFHTRGVVYKEYSPYVHERDFTYAAPNSHIESPFAYPDPVICVLDPHDRLPHHVIWAFLDRMDNVYVDRELVMEGTVRELQRAILMEEQRAGYKIRRRLIDPNFGRKPLITTGKTVIQELATPPFGLKFSEANDDKTAGILKVKDALHYDATKPLGLTNSPKLFFSNKRVAKTIHSIRNYQYEEWKSALRDNRDPKETDKQKDTHGADVCRYLMMSNPFFKALQEDLSRYELVEAAY